MYVMVVVAVSTHLTGGRGGVILNCSDNMVECRRELFKLKHISENNRKL